MTALMKRLNPYFDVVKSTVSEQLASATARKYPAWKQALLAGGALVGSCVVYTAASYFYCKLRYPAVPTIYHTITGDINQNAGIIVFIHGWPDFDYLWEKQIEFFSQKNYCCINMEIPNFNIDRIQNPWGYHLHTVVTAMANTLATILKDRKCILFAHDWGALLAQFLYLNHRETIAVSKLLLLDVADLADRDESGRFADAKIKQQNSYQKILVAGSLMHASLGTLFLRKLIQAAPNTLPILEKERKDQRVYFSSHSSYLYWAMLPMHHWIYGSVQDVDITARLHEFDGLSILFVVGAKGSASFYSSKFKAFMQQRDYCKMIEFDDCGHWIMRDNADKLNQTALDFFRIGYV